MQSHFKDQKIEVSWIHKTGVSSDEYMNITEDRMNSPGAGVRSGGCQPRKLS